MATVKTAQGLVWCGLGFMSERQIVILVMKTMYVCILLHDQAFILQNTANQIGNSKISLLLFFYDFVKKRRR